jgi:uncharacterized protein YdeI (BOF family)
MKLKYFVFALLMPAAFTLAAQEAQIETQDPRQAGDGSWVAISGKVKSTGHEQFTLDHEGGTINVQVERDDLEGREHKILEGEQVTVYGLVDEGFFRSTRILARAIFVESMSTYVYTTDGVNEVLEVFTPVMTSGIAVYGEVRSISGNNIVLDDGDRRITVDASALATDPNGGDDVKSVQVGDMITAVGSTSREFFTGRTLRATSLHKLGTGSEERFDAGHDHDREH